MLKASPFLIVFLFLCACGCKDHSTEPGSKQPDASSLRKADPNTLQRIVALSSIDFAEGTSVPYEGGGRSGHQSWIVYGNRLRDAVFAAVDRGLWSEVSPDTGKRVLAAKLPIVATVRPTQALLGEWIKNGKKFSGILLLCENGDVLQLELLP